MPQSPQRSQLWFTRPNVERIFFCLCISSVHQELLTPSPGHPGHGGTVICAAMFFLNGDALCVYFLFPGLHLISEGSQNILCIFDYRYSALLKSPLLQPTMLERAEGPGDVWSRAVNT